MRTETKHAESGCTDYLQHPWDSCPENKPKAQHSPLPWTYSAIGGDNFIMSQGVPVAEVLYDEAQERISIEQMDANKVLIVASVNHAGKLAEALDDITLWLGRSVRADDIEMAADCRAVLVAYLNAREEAQ